MSEPATMNFPLCGFVTMRDDTPIFVWGIANPDDGAAVAHLTSNIRDCASTYTAGRSLATDTALTPDSTQDNAE